MISKLLNWLGIKRTKSITIVIKLDDDVPDNLIADMFKAISERIIKTLDNALNCGGKYKNSEMWDNIKGKIKW
ncbi:hypothetical protein Trichorick_01384 (plasmid) [Candidatus Trichorickettsia mobilis]|uniref:Uncharacterized protein n=1 Tax=Candidatus Trichorickettsia mobilis TaxID=1346319 RepID=A0ABZ0UV29_9RICK|nr:hypothetical protein [Candidatus Trichorickettsia mobilis]WPY01471.1 hypothetical protein Trichorick_01384 [Candidatus Trichorickettsia mobilis]